MAGLPPQPPARPNAPVPPSGNQSKGVWIGVGVTLALAILALLGLSAAGILRFGAEAKDSGALAKQGSVPNRNLLSAEGQTSPPVLEQDATREVPLTMPADIYEWLRHLEETEKRKNDLTLRQVADMKVFQQMFSVLGAGMGELNPYDQTGEEGTPPADVAKGKFEDLQPAWNELVQFFASRQPPEECRQLADEYYRALNEIPAMVGDINGILNQVSADPSAALQSLGQMKTQSYMGIDKYLQSSDERLDAICKKYNTQKWFNIRADVAGTGMLGKMGL